MTPSRGATEATEKDFPDRPESLAPPRATRASALCVFLLHGPRRLARLTFWAAFRRISSWTLPDRMSFFSEKLDFIDCFPERQGIVVISVRTTEPTGMSQKGGKRSFDVRAAMAGMRKTRKSRTCLANGAYPNLCRPSQYGRSAQRSFARRRGGLVKSVGNQPWAAGPQLPESSGLLLLSRMVCDGSSPNSAL